MDRAVPRLVALYTSCITNARAKVLRAAAAAAVGALAMYDPVMFLGKDASCGFQLRLQCRHEAPAPVCVLLCSGTGCKAGHIRDNHCLVG